MKIKHTKLAAFMGLAVAVTGLLVLAGWQFEIEFLKRPIPNLVAMNPMTALCFVLSGGGIVLLSAKNTASEWSLTSAVIIRLTAIVLMIAGLLKLIDFIFVLGIKPDQLLFTEKIIEDTYAGISNRIAPTSAVNMMLAGVSLWLIGLEDKGFNAAANYLALIIFVIGIFSLIGYFYRIDEFYGFLAVLPMAVHTALCWMMLAMSILFINYNKGFMLEFTSPDSGGKLARILLPTASLMPVFLGYAVLLLNRQLNISADMSVAIIVSLLVVLSFFFVRDSAVMLNKKDALKEADKQKLASLNHELENANARFYNFFNSSPVATNLTKIINGVPEGNITDTNEAFLKLFGFTREEVIGKKLVDLNLINQEMRETLNRKLIENNFLLKNMEVTLIARNGIARNVLYSTQKTGDNEGDYLLYTMLDITERKSVEENLKNSLKEVSDYKYALDESSIVAITNHKGIITFANDNFCKISKYSREELIGQDHRIINSGFHPKEFIRDLWVTIANGKIWRGELKNKAKDGTAYWVDTTIVPFLNEEGKPYQYVAIRADITAKVMIDTALKQTRDSLASAQKIAHMGSWEWNIVTNKEVWSDEQYRIFGYEPNEVEATYTLFQNALHPDDKAAVGIAVEQALAGIKPFAMEYRIIRKDEAVRSIEAKGEIERDSEGKPAKMRGTVLDITERKETEEKLKHYYLALDAKNKEIEQFAFIASHDLQEPLRTINSFNELLAKEYAEKFDDNGKIYLKYISQSSSRMRELITGLLDYSRLGNKRVLRNTDCNTLLNEVLANLHTAVSESGAVIEADTLPVIKAYELELSLLFQNLIANAIKFRKKDVALHLKINAAYSNNEWTFAFSDNGIGIKEKHFEKIFVIFQRLHARGAYEGTGIGLSHCKKIVELHGGKMWVESTAGIGSTFYFTIAERIN